MNVDSLSKQVLFNVVRIENQSRLGLSSGTGFIMDAAPSGERNKQGGTLPVIVTNKHVVANADVIRVNFVARQDLENKPLLGSAAQVTFQAGELAIVGHPDPAIDIAIIPLVPLLNATDRPAFYSISGRELMPTAMAAAELDALEEVTFVGYPNGWYDTQHHTPIIRRGITATPIVLPWSGRPVFLVDGSVFGGSSGSPVFLLNEGSYSHKGGFTVGSRLLLVGILAETLVRHSNLPLAVQSAPYAKLAQEMNLGVAFDYQTIEQTLDYAWDMALSNEGAG